MLLGTGCETAARELQGRLGHFPKLRLRPFTKRLVRAYVSFDKASEQIHSVLYAFGHRHRRKVARLFQRHLRFTDIAPKILRIQMLDLAPVDDIVWTVRRDLCPARVSQNGCDLLAGQILSDGPIRMIQSDRPGGKRMKRRRGGANRLINCRRDPPAKVLAARISMSHLVPLLEFNRIGGEDRKNMTSSFHQQRPYGGKRCSRARLMPGVRNSPFLSSNRLNPSIGRTK
jgi:hypothetical protein